MTNIIDIGKKLNDAGYTSPKQALEEAILSLGKEGEGAFYKGNKLVILCLDDTDGQYHVTYINAGMKMSQCVSVCEVAKQIFLKEMNY